MGFGRTRSPGPGGRTGLLQRRWLAGFAAVALSGSACQATGAASGDKAGTPTVTLRFATIDELDPNGQTVGPKAFVDALSGLSHGRIKTEVAGNYGNGASTAESDLVTAIAAGKLDGGFPATRAFPDAGVGALEAVEAPMTVTSYAAEKALVNSPVADQLLATLDGSGVTGLGLTVGPLRRPFASGSPLLALSDWKAVPFRIYHSPVQADTISALGAQPVDASFSFIAMVREGRLRGGETDLAQYDHNRYGAEAGNVTSNVVLWPKVLVLAMNQRRLAALSPQQQGWVREAARRAVRASAEATYDESTSAANLCHRGVTLHEASATQLDELRAAVRPVIDHLAADPRTGPTLAAIQAVVAAHPDPDVPRVQGPCTADSTTPGPVPDTPAGLPDGVYRTTVTKGDLDRAGLTNGSGDKGTWTLTVRDAEYRLTCHPLDEAGRDCGSSISDDPLEAGHLRGHGQTAYFVYDPGLLAKLTGCTLPPSNTRQGACWDGFSYRMDWSLSGDELRFSDYVGALPDDQYLLTPWKKIA